MLRASEELAAVFRRILDAFERRDVETLRGLLSDTKETMIVGSDVEEWLEGIEATEVFLAQVNEMPPVAVTVHRLDAFEEGTVGWVAADTTTELDTGATARFRYTVVCFDSKGEFGGWFSGMPRCRRIQRASASNSRQASPSCWSP